ncbi:MAG: hypothetical protein QG570_81 [Patescibacteria group bacterium]|nr:hypothetical protein [Patescibacteria group bacterium]
MGGMISLITQNPLLGLILVFFLAISIGFHEAAHAYSAYWLGDPTPKLQKRLSLNPLVHLDPIGSLMILFIGFGWGKAVEFNPHNLKSPRKDAALIALAGPATNILIAIICSIIALVVNLSGLLSSEISLLITVLMQTLASLNVMLAIFNLIPIEPLDGFKVVAGILPSHLAYKWYETRQYGLYILLFLLLTGAIGGFITPIIDFITSFLF